MWITDFSRPEPETESATGFRRRLRDCAARSTQRNGTGATE
jgi:hypothetical protein